MIPVQKGIKTLQAGGPAVFTQRTLYYLGLWNNIWNTVTSRRQFGTNIFEREWDLLIVLDAGRADFLRDFTDTYQWLNSVNQMVSVGSMSAEWVVKTFTKKYREEIGQTAFISRNVWSERILADRVHDPKYSPEKKEYDHVRSGYPAWDVVTPQAFCHYERVQPKANQDDRIHPESTSVPHIVTDRAINVGRTVDCDQLIVWYRMPHLKFFAEAVDWSQDMNTDQLMSGPEPIRELTLEEKSYAPAQRGDVTIKHMRKIYRQNLAFVLSYVDTLLQNIDAEKVVVTADHGEALGDDAVWGHPFGYPWSPVKTVPWAKTTAADEETYNSRFGQLDAELLSEDRREMLRDMGYI